MAQPEEGEEDDDARKTQELPHLPNVTAGKRQHDRQDPHQHEVALA